MECVVGNVGVFLPYLSSILIVAFFVLAKDREVKIQEIGFVFVALEFRHNSFSFMAVCASWACVPVYPH